MAVRKRHHRKVRVLAAGRRVDSHKKTRVKLDPKWNRLVEHLFQKRLLEALVDTVESNTAHF